MARLPRCFSTNPLAGYPGLALVLAVVACHKDKAAPAADEDTNTPTDTTENADHTPDSEDEQSWYCWDGDDNDEDGLVDCDDPDCADSPECLEYGECDKDWKVTDIEDVIAKFDIASLYDGEETVRFYSCSAWDFERDFNECIDGAHQWEDDVTEIIVGSVLQELGLESLCSADAKVVCGPLSPAQAAEVTGDPDELWCCYATKVTVECSW